MKKLFDVNNSYHGDGTLCYSWQADGSYLASVGSNSLLVIFDRHGQQVDEVALHRKTSCMALEWDSEGETLAILQESNGGVVPLYDLHKKKLKSVDFRGGNHEVTLLKWSIDSAHLALGTLNGALLLYDANTKRTETIVGKHSLEVVSGSWGYGNLLALGSRDRTITISTSDGTTLVQHSVRSTPMHVRFSVSKGPQTVSALLGGEALWCWRCMPDDNSSVPREIEFPSNRGNIVAYKWLEETLVVGFSSGTVVVVSAKEATFGEELFAKRLCSGRITDLEVSPIMKKIAVSSAVDVKVVDATALGTVDASPVSSLKVEHGEIDLLHWSGDGQILSLSTTNGSILNYLAKMPLVHSSHGDCVAYLSSLREVTIISALDLQQGNRRQIVLDRVELENEPTQIAIGPTHLAVALNNKVWFYSVQTTESCEDDRDGRESKEDEQRLAHEQEYNASVDKLLVNDRFAAVLCGGKVYVRAVESEESTDICVLPGNHKDCEEIKDFCLSPHHLIYATSNGSLEYYSLDDRAPIAHPVFTHDLPIKNIFNNSLGTLCVVIDSSGNGFIVSPMPEQDPVVIPELSGNTGLVLWDVTDPLVFITADLIANSLGTYVYRPSSLDGPVISKIGPTSVTAEGDIIMEPKSTQLPKGFVPIVSVSGVISCQQTSSKIGSVVLGSHEALHRLATSTEIKTAKFLQCLALLKLEDAWLISQECQNTSFWLALSGKAMELLQIDLAIRARRKIGDAGMVLALERIRFVEDIQLLAAHISALFGDFVQAQKLFILAGHPNEALSMRKDLLDWEQALELAKTTYPEEVPEISFKYAQQLEFHGEYPSALDMYQVAFERLQKSSADGSTGRAIQGEPIPNSIRPEQVFDKNAVLKMEKKINHCSAGIARMALRVGNIPRGVSIASELGDPRLCKECADILLAANQLADAGPLYERAGEFESAAAVYIRMKNFARVAPLVDRISQPRIHLQYAKAKEAEKDYRTAVESYKRAGETESVVRVYLEKLSMPEKAIAVVRETSSPAGAKLVAKYCRETNDFVGAIEFLILANQTEEAFHLAVAHDERHRTVKAFEIALGEDGGTPEEYANIAKYYETKQEWSKAGDYYTTCGQYYKALKLFLQGGTKDLDKAIEVVGKARTDVLTHTLISFLSGETDGEPKPKIYVFRLYLALGKFPQAAQMANGIARQELDQGRLRAAHEILFETYRELRSRGIRIPQKVQDSLLVVHSYFLAKLRRKKVGDHLGAARLIKRVALNISSFPQQIAVNVLTFGVIECIQAGLKRTAFEFAAILMRPENRSEIQDKHKKKIEKIFRHGNNNLSDIEQERSPSLYSGVMMDEYDLVCPTTRNRIPFCVITGKHMLKDDWCFCPNTGMPALHSEYVRYLTSLPDEERVDPVWNRPISPEQLVKVHDIDVSQFPDSTESFEDTASTVLD